MSSKLRKDTRRRNTRAPVTIEVRYRTAGSFLVSYSLNLSRGGLFLETPDRYPLGTTLAVRFSVPQVDEAIETQAKVVWQRTRSSSKGPAGCGLSFDQLDSEIGTRIDEMVRSFVGVTMLVVASDAAAEPLARDLCNVITSTVIRASTMAEANEHMKAALDLTIVDMDSLDGGDCLAIIEAAAKQPTPIPVIALVKNARQEAVASAAGVDLTLSTPIRHDELRDKVLAILGKPARTA